MLDTDCLVGLDTQANIRNTLNMFGKRQHLDDVDLPNAMYLNDSARRNLDKYKKLFAENKKVGMFGASTADVSQDPDFRHRAGAILPAFQKSTTLISLSTGDDHIFTAGEASFANGWPLPGVSPVSKTRCLNYDISKLSLNLQHSLLGDGMDIHAVEALAPMDGTLEV